MAAAAVLAMAAVIAGVVTATVMLTAGFGPDGSSVAASSSSGPSVPSSTSGSAAASAGDEAEIERVVAAYAKALTSGDGESLGPLVCSQDLDVMQRSVVGGGAELPSGLPDYEVTDIVVDGDKATAEFGFASLSATIAVALVKENGSWKVCPSAG